MYHRLACLLVASCCLSLKTVIAEDTVPPKELTKDEETQKNLSKSLLTFTSGLLKNLQYEAKPNENIIFSPVNIYSALSLVQLGAAGGTRDELIAVLGWQKTDDQESKQHQNFGEMMKSYSQRRGQKQLTRVNIANGIFVQKSYPIKDTYTKEMQKSYGGEIRNVDFTSGSQATDTINKWASNATEGRIPQLLSQPLKPDTRVMIATSLYFNGRWDEAFIKSKTRKDNFTTDNGVLEVQMMNKIEYMPYFDNPSLQFQAVQLYYDGGDYSMFIILPYPSQTLANLSNSLTPDEWQKLVTQVNSAGIDCKMPRFKFSMQKSLVQPLKQQGLNSVFSYSDLGNMVSINADLRISDVQHAAEIEVDELGTKAASITTVQISYLSGPIIPRNPVQFYANRPFMFGLFHHATSSFLFIGLVNKPVV